MAKQTNSSVDIAALRCMRAQFLDTEECRCVLDFMEVFTRDMENEYEEQFEARLQRASTMVRKWVGLCVQYSDASRLKLSADAPTADDTPEDAMTDVADLAAWLGRLRAPERWQPEPGDDELCGYFQIMNLIERRLSNVAQRHAPTKQVQR